MIWDSEDIPEEMVKGIYIMFYKKKDRNCFANYRAICLLCHAYKLLSTVISKRMYVDLEEILPDSQAGFRQARGTRDNICILVGKQDDTLGITRSRDYVHRLHCSL